MAGGHACQRLYAAASGLVYPGRADAAHHRHRTGRRFYFAGVLQQTQTRYGAWITGALWLLLASGGLLIVAEPVRELVTLSFWLKMALVVCLVVLVTVFGRYVRQAAAADQPVTPAMRWFAALTLLLLVAIIVLGRLIAYDHVWGSLSPATKA